MNLIAHVEIPARDLERAMAFYAAVFAIDFGPVANVHGNRMAFFPFAEGQDGASGALCEGEVYVPTRDGAIVYFAVEDIDATISRAVALGSELLFPKTEAMAGMFVAEISDSEGNRLALQGR
jgi:predicted enzyme related to lactoylglutathione lyase